MCGYLLLALVWEPFASPLKIGAGGVVVASLALFACWRILRDRPTAAVLLLLMRLAVIAAITTLLFGPSRELPQSEQAARPRLSILIDTSESMLTSDCAGATRIDHVAQDVLSDTRLRALETEFEIQLHGFDVDLSPLPIEDWRMNPQQSARGRATHLAENVSRAISRLEGSGDAVLVVSDGRDTDDAPVQPAASQAAARGVPIFTVGVGGDQSAVDAALLAIPLQEALLPGEPGGILLKVYQSGLAGETAVATLTTGGESQQFTIPLGQQTVIERQLPIQRDAPGQLEVQVSLDPVGGETELSNNVQTVFVDVLPRKIRVLLLEGEPFWDTKFLAQSLRKDEQVELTQITQLGDAQREKIVTRRDGAAPTVPSTPAEWSAYDVVIVGRGLDRLLDAAAATALADYVRDGGQLVLSRGPAWDASTPRGEVLQSVLEVLLPVVWSDAEQESLTLSITPSGLTAAWFSASKLGADVAAAFARLPGFERMTGVVREKSSTLVLARANSREATSDDGFPAVTRMAYGRGQIVGILGEGLWRWSLLPPELQDLQGFYDTFWSNLVRWLALGGDFAPGQDVALQLSRTSARFGDELTVDVVYRRSPPTAAPPRLTLRTPDGQSSDVALHELPGQSPRFRAALTPATVGVHHLTVETPGVSPPRLERRLNVYDVNLERLQASADYPALQQLASLSGGTMFDAADLSGLGTVLKRHRQALLVPPRREPLWDRGWIMTLLLLWAGAEWLIRRLFGLW